MEHLIFNGPFCIKSILNGLNEWTTPLSNRGQLNGPESIVQFSTQMVIKLVYSV